MKKGYTIVTDPGIDDIIALFLLYKLSPKSKNSIISSFGNTKEKFTSKNAKEAIRLINRMWYFHRGPDSPSKKVKFRWPIYFHGTDGVWDVHTNIDITKVKEQNKPKIYRDIISLSPLTEVKNILDGASVDNLYMMGGSINVPGNETKYSETNIFFDPYAADHIFKKANTTKIKVIPLDVTREICWTIGDVRKINGNTRYKSWIKRIMLAWFKNYGSRKNMNFELHDPLAILLVIYPELAEWEEHGIKVIQRGKRMGQTVLCKDRPKVEIASKIKDPLKMKSMISKLLM